MPVVNEHATLAEPSRAPPTQAWSASFSPEPSFAPPSSSMLRSELRLIPRVSPLRKRRREPPLPRGVRCHRPPHVPPSGSRTLSTAYSSRRYAGLLHPASDPGVRAVSGSSDLSTNRQARKYLPRHASHTPRRIPLASSRIASPRPLPPCRLPCSRPSHRLRAFLAERELQAPLPANPFPGVRFRVSCSHVRLRGVAPPCPTRRLRRFEPRVLPKVPRDESVALVPRFRDPAPCPSMGFVPLQGVPPCVPDRVGCSPCRPLPKEWSVQTRLRVGGPCRRVAGDPAPIPRASPRSPTWRVVSRRSSRPVGPRYTIPPELWEARFHSPHPGKGTHRAAWSLFDRRLGRPWRLAEARCSIRQPSMRFSTSKNTPKSNSPRS
jgi:hypothetical protein